ncbi:hypothetical protein M9Y10_028160 [Tritrichomonas musculus]|uniref:Uncharacterized protein n=1 Tax=Tritrichomonas musculus TaxID=1915356 RepID=A0ABR2KIQ2_9EUKA
MDMDEWDNIPFDEWEVESYENHPIADAPCPSLNSESMSNPPMNADQTNILSPNLYPEVEIGSSSDEEAPPLPESNKLARENLELRQKVEQLVNQSKSAENKNKSLKKQLFKCRNIFKHQIKSMKKAFK